MDLSYTVAYYWPAQRKSQIRLAHSRIITRAIDLNIVRSLSSEDAYNLGTCDVTSLPFAKIADENCDGVSWIQKFDRMIWSKCHAEHCWDYFQIIWKGHLALSQVVMTKRISVLSKTVVIDNKMLPSLIYPSWK